MYIKENHSSITLQKLSNKFNFSKEYLPKLIKEKTKSSFSDIVIESRLVHAIKLLVSTNLGISDIAYQIGYENVENFIRIFKKNYGVTPSIYRKKFYKNK